MHLNPIDAEELIALHIVLEGIIVVRFTDGNASTIDARIFGANQRNNAGGRTGAADDLDLM